jgi:hypothetical protein
LCYECLRERCASLEAQVTSLRIASSITAKEPVCFHGKPWGGVSVAACAECDELAIEAISAPKGDA